jgi:hypothetical protein
MLSATMPQNIPSVGLRIKCRFRPHRVELTRTTGGPRSLQTGESTNCQTDQEFQTLDGASADRRAIWFEKGTAENYALYSKQGGAYDDILKYLKL